MHDKGMLRSYNCNELGHSIMNCLKSRNLANSVQ